MDILAKVPEIHFPFDNQGGVPPIDSATHREFLDELTTLLSETRYLCQKHRFEDFSAAIKSFIESNNSQESRQLADFMKLSNNEVQQRTKGSGIDGDNFDMLVLESMNRKLMRHLDRLNDLPVQTVLLGSNAQHYQDQYEE